MMEQETKLMPMKMRWLWLVVIRIKRTIIISKLIINNTKWGKIKWSSNIILFMVHCSLSVYMNTEHCEHSHSLSSTNRFDQRAITRVAHKIPFYNIYYYYFISGVFHDKCYQMNNGTIHGSPIWDHMKERIPNTDRTKEN